MRFATELTRHLTCRPRRVAGLIGKKQLGSQFKICNFSLLDTYGNTYFSKLWLGIVAIEKRIYYCAAIVANLLASTSAFAKLWSFCGFS